MSQKKFRPAKPSPATVQPANQPIPDQVRAMLQAEVYSETRPIPRPQEMAEYDALVPGAAGRFITAWEAETAHRRAVELIRLETVGDEIKAVALDRRLGLLLSFALGAGTLGSLVYMGVAGVSLIGMAPVLLAGGSLVWAVRRSTSTPLPPPSGGGKPVESSE